MTELAERRATDSSEDARVNEAEEDVEDDEPCENRLPGGKDGTRDKGMRKTMGQLGGRKEAKRIAEPPSSTSTFELELSTEERRLTD